MLPTDKETSTWFVENIDKDCSASSAIYKFRQWLKDREDTELLRNEMFQKLGYTKNPYPFTEIK